VALLPRARPAPAALIVAQKRIQADRKGGCPGDERYRGTVDCLVKTLRSEGVAGLFKGLASALPNSFLTNLIFYMMSAWLEPLLTRIKSVALRGFVSGVVSGCILQCIMVPFELVNTRIVASKTQEGFWAMLVRIVRHEGLPGLYRGMVPSLLLTINPGLNGMVARLLLPPERVAQASADTRFRVGAASKAVASLATYPYLIARTQIQTYESKARRAAATPGADAAAGDAVTEDDARELELLPVLVRILREDGLLGIYRGCELTVATSILREAITNVARHPVRAALLRAVGAQLIP
jgi:adenine nucleotide transporter 17